MTSPYSALQGLPGFGGGSPVPLQGLPGFSPPPQAVSQPGGPVSALPPMLQGTGAAQYDAARPVENVGMGATIATQAGRGLLDAALGSGAIAGSATESLGNVIGWKGLEDFGRDLGRSANGAAAMEAASFLFGKAVDGNKRGLTYADKTSQAIEEQERAWPMLTTVSRIGGGVAFALATGGLSGATGGVGARLAGTAGLGAYEGAAAGMQTAYSQNESLRDVLVSGATGLLFGAASGGAVHGIAALPGAVGRGLERGLEGDNLMAQVFGKARTAADEVAQVVKNAGGGEIAAAAKAVLKERADVLRQVAEAGENPTLIRQAYDRATHAAGEKLSKLAGDFEPADWATKTISPVQKLLHRTPILDRVSEDLAGDAAKLSAARPTIDFELKVPGKLLADADKTAAIFGLQSRVTQAIEQIPDPRLRGIFYPISERLAQADAAESMALGHKLVQKLASVARSANVDGVTASFAKRQASALADELSGDAWGGAGKAYKALTRLDGPLEGVDAKTLRRALQDADASAQVPGVFAEQNAQLTAAYEARKALGGEGLDKATKTLMSEAADRAERGHAAVTFDGAPARRVLDIISGAGRNVAESYGSDLLGKGVAMGVGAMVGGVPGMIVARMLSPYLGEITGVAFGKLGGRIAARAGEATVAASRGVKGATSEAAKEGLSWQQNNYRTSITKLATMLAQGTPEADDMQRRALASLPPEVQTQVGADMQTKLSQLMADIPKPTPNIRGEAYEQLSRSDLKKAQAMWEATMQPMSVFSDFSRGMVDYDKVQYAWKQWPGLKTAAQAGLIDILHAQLSDDDRAGVSDIMLTQLDNLFGFEGTLQPTLDHGFSSRMDQLMQQQEAPRPKPQSSGPLKLPGSQPTFTERLSGQR